MNHHLAILFTFIFEHLIIIADALCISLFMVHLTDVDEFFKIIASGMIILVNAFAIYAKYIKKPKK